MKYIQVQASFIIVLAVRMSFAADVKYINGFVGYTALFDNIDSIEEEPQPDRISRDEKQCQQYLNSHSLHEPSPDLPIVVPQSSFMWLPNQNSQSRQKRSTKRHRRRGFRLNCSLPNARCFKKEDGTSVFRATPTKIVEQAPCHLYHYHPVECRMIAGCNYNCSTDICSENAITSTDCSIHCGDPCGCTNRAECEWQPDQQECIAAAPFSKLLTSQSTCKRLNKVYSVRGQVGLNLIKREECPFVSNLVGINFGSNKTIKDEEGISYTQENNVTTLQRYDRYKVYKAVTFKTNDTLFSTGIIAEPNTCGRIGEKCVVYYLNTKKWRPRTYELGLKLYEGFPSKPGDRRFTVRFGGKILLQEFDILKFTEKSNLTVYAEVTVLKESIIIGGYEAIPLPNILQLEICTGMCAKNPSFVISGFYMAAFGPNKTVIPTTPAPTPPTAPSPTVPPIRVDECLTHWLPEAKDGFSAGKTESGEEIYICRYFFDGKMYHGGFYAGACHIWAARLYFQSVTSGYEILQDVAHERFIWLKSTEFPEFSRLVLGTEGTTFSSTYVVKCPVGSKTEIGHGPKNKKPYYIDGSTVQKCPEGYEYLTCGEIPTPPPLPTPTPPPENRCRVMWKKNAKTGFELENNAKNKVYVCRYFVNGKYFHGGFKNGGCHIWINRIRFEKIITGYELLQLEPALTWKPTMEFPTNWKLVLGTEDLRTFKETYIVRCKASDGKWQVGHGPVNKMPYYLDSDSIEKCINGYEYLTCGDVKPVAEKGRFTQHKSAIV